MRSDLERTARRTSRTVLLLVVLELAAPSPGRAERVRISEADREEALSLDDAAQQAADANHLDLAIREAEQALRLAYAPVRLFNLGLLHEKNCQITAATSFYFQFREAAHCSAAREGSALARDCEDAASRIVHADAARKSCDMIRISPAQPVQRPAPNLLPPPPPRPLRHSWTSEPEPAVEPGQYVDPRARNRTIHYATASALCALTLASIVLAADGYSAAESAHASLLRESVPVNAAQRGQLLMQGNTGNAMGLTGVLFVPVTLIPALVLLLTAN